MTEVTNVANVAKVAKVANVANVANVEKGSEEKKTVNTSFSCKKMVSDTVSSLCCCCPYSISNYCLDFPLINFSEYTLRECQNACSRNPGYAQDDIRCCCFVCTPVAFALDITLLPFKCVYYIHKQHKNGMGIPCYYNDSSTDKNIITVQPRK
jgi:hypothetical protein